MNKQQKSDRTFVSRWSRLKHASIKAAETEADVNTAMQSNTDMAGTGQTDEILPVEDQQNSGSNEAILTDKDMPDIETLTPESDYTGFLSPGVSEGLRKLALRKLFSSEAFNIRDGLDEYDGDYTSFEKLGDIVTADMRHQFELEAKRKAEQLIQDDDRIRDDSCVDDIGINEQQETRAHGVTAVTSPATNHARVDKSPNPPVDETGDGQPVSDSMQAVGLENDNELKNPNSPEALPDSGIHEEQEARSSKGKQNI